ncbi:RNAse P Rpr2/Rpp21/SNM1 subunit domain-containing protein, partial [Chytriomyces sp. MP71]
MGKSKKLAKNQSKQREKLVAGRDALVRMNYLLQISNAMAPTSASLASLSRFYARNMKQVGARMVLRLDPSVKRAVCKRCDSILIPGLSASVEV